MPGVLGGVYTSGAAAKAPGRTGDFASNSSAKSASSKSATRAATRYYDTVPDGEPLFNDGGGFWYDFGSDRLVWAVDGGDAVEYDYDRDAYDDAYKLYKRGVENATVFYKVSMNCQYQSHPSPGFNTCSLNFVCKDIVETEFISADGLPAEPGTEIYSGDC